MGMIRKKYKYVDPDLIGVPEERTQKELNEFMLNGGDTSELAWADYSYKLDKIPQDIINERLSNGYGCGWVDSEKFAAIPYPIRVFTEKAKNALRLYESEQISLDNLPDDVYVNADARKELLEIVREQSHEKLEAICQTYGFDVNVPPAKVLKKYHSILIELEEKIEAYRQKALKSVKKLSRKGKKDIKSSLSDMDDEFDLK